MCTKLNRKQVFFIFEVQKYMKTLKAFNENRDHGDNKHQENREKKKGSDEWII